MTASSDTKGHASLQVKLVWCCTHSCGLISNLPCDPYGSCHVLEVQPHGQMPRLQKHIILDILRSPSYCLLTPLMSPKDKNCKLID